MKTNCSSDDFRIRLCRNTSEKQIAERLISLNSIEIGVTEAMDIWVSHKSSHWRLLEDAGVAESDFVMLGNVSLGVELFENGGRNAVVRLKASDYWQWSSAVDAAVDAYCKPVAERYRKRSATLPAPVESTGLTDDQIRAGVEQLRAFRRQTI